MSFVFSLPATLDRHQKLREHLVQLDPNEVPMQLGVSETGGPSKIGILTEMINRQLPVERGPLTTQTQLTPKDGWVQCGSIESIGNNVNHILSCYDML